MKLYKPSRSNKGYAFSINFSARTDKFDDNNRLVKGDKSFYIQMVRQNGFNEKTGNGIFKDGYKVIVKIAPHEAAAMIAAINRNISMAEAMNTKYVYHDGAESATTVVFEPYFKSEKRGDQWIKSNVQSGFIFKVTKVNKSNEQEKENLGIAFNWGETELLNLFESWTFFNL
jgi:phosphoribosyl-AMP cyclohydrolase